MFSGLYDQVQKTFTTALTPQQNPVYRDYEQRAVIGFDRDAVLQRDKASLTAINKTNDHGFLNVKPRDIYLKGPVERYDFCTELLDSTIGPFALKCLQTEFLRQGGQHTGTLYPSEANLNYWNTRPRWINVKQEIQEIITRTLSAKQPVKEKAMMEFYGIGLAKEPVPIDPQYGVEVFWFTHTTDITNPTTFIGRRIRPKVLFMDSETLEPGSAVFFTSVIANKMLQAKYRVSSLSGFSLYFNEPVTKVYNNKTLNTGGELASLHNGGTAVVVSVPITLTTGINRLGGFMFYKKGRTYYKLEILSEEFGPQGCEIPASHLQLTQEPFAPMISFEVEQNPGTWGCDYPFCDKRLGGFKMKWENDGWGGPSLQYRGESVDQGQFPLRKNYMSFPNGRCAIKSKFSLRLYSFMTMTFLFTIRSIPKNGELAKPFCLWGPAGGSPTIFVRGHGNNLATVNVGTHTGSVMTKDGPLVGPDIPYLMTLKMIRTNEMDPLTIELVRLGIAPVRYLQQNPDVHKYMKETSKLALPNITSEEPAYFRIQSENMGFDLHWIHMFDYILDGVNLHREARADWGYLP
jgi:hypothetical protein